MKKQQLHGPIDWERRKLSVALTTCFAAMPLYPAAHAFAATGSQPALVNRENFRLLSVYLTRHANLDAHTLDLIYDALVNEPWGKEHMKRLLHKLFPELPDSTRPRSEYFVVRQLDDAEAWFAGHILTTWMTGIYYHETGNRTLTYRHALMFDALRDIRPVPGLSTEPFGFWSAPPKAISS